MTRPRALGDPFVSSLAVLVALAGAGLVALVLAWREAADLVQVADQVPYVVSGGVGGLALVGFSAGVLAIQARRWQEARRRAAFDRVVRAATELLVAVREADGRRS